MKKNVFIVVLIAILLSLVPTSVAFAEDAVYSDVLVDLKKDPNFDVSSYSVDLGDNSIDIITLAEGENDELYVYTYQPAIQRAFYCSSINISRHDPEDENSAPSYDNYRLSYCNSNGVFYKYIVERFTVLSDSVRYYCISQVMRPFDPAIDTQPNGQTISEVPIKRNDDTVVSKEYVFQNAEGQTKVECKDLTTIEIKSKIVGFVRYQNGAPLPFGILPSHTDSHFVAFSTEMPIDDLYDADVKWEFNEYSVSYNSWEVPDYSNVRYKNEYNSESDLTPLYADVVREQESNRIFAYHYEFNQIQTVEELLEEEEMNVVYNGVFVKIEQGISFTSEAKTALQNQQWVLRFTETSFTVSAPIGASPLIVESGTRVFDVMVLRLHFKSDGKEYNLGVVDNKQTGSVDPLGQTQTTVDLVDELKSMLWIFLFVLGVIALLILLRLLSPIIKLFLGIIALPFKAIKRLGRKNNEVRRSRIPDKPNSRYRRW